MEKKTLAMLLAVCLMATAVIGGSLAYFTDTDTKTNTFTVGKVDITLTEDKWVEDSKIIPGATIDKNPTINLLKKKGVHLMPLTELIEVTKKGAKVKNVETGEEQLIECDTVLTSLGVEQNTDLYDEIVKVWPHAKLIGDATTPDGKVYRTLEAVKGGYQASMAI